VAEWQGCFPWEWDYAEKHQNDEQRADAPIGGFPWNGVHSLRQPHGNAEDEYQQD
jgi:formylglycine-generating enzyme required for sulfatase activity